MSAEEYTLGRIVEDNPGGIFGDLPYRAGDIVVVVGAGTYTTDQLIPQTIEYFTVIDLKDLTEDGKLRNGVPPFRVPVDEVELTTTHTNE